jgi:hypothetical protein
MSFEDDWEEQDLDLGLTAAVVDVEDPEASLTDKEEDVKPTVGVQVAKPVGEQGMLTPCMYVSGIIEKSCQVFQAQKKLPPYKRAIKQYNMERDTSIQRMDIIRDILDGHAILINGVIEWKHAFALRRYNANDSALRNPSNWVIRTNLEKHKQFVKGCDDKHYALTKAQLKKGERPY